MGSLVNRRKPELGQRAPRAAKSVSMCWLMCLMMTMFVVCCTSSAVLAATPLSYPKQCGQAGNPACNALQPVPTPWVYTLNPLFATPTPIFHSIDDAANWYIATYTPAMNACSIGFAGATEGQTPDSGGVPAYWYGQPIRDAYTLNFSVVRYATNNCLQTVSEIAYLLLTRQFSCPANTTFFYQASPLEGPSCQYRTTAAAQPPSPQKQTGCPCNQRGDSGSSGGADSGANRSLGGDHPVDISNGNEFLAEVDYVGAGASPLKFVRTYNSLGAYENSNLVSGTPQPSLAAIAGTGWTASYFQSLTFTSVTDSTGTYNSVYAFRPDGRILIFTQYQGVYTPDADVADSLAQTATGWQYQTADDTIETYSADGRLLSTAARGQAGVTVSYSPGAAPGDPPLSVSDTFGHTLQFAYAPDLNKVMRLASITDPAGNVVNYVHGGYGNSGNLTKVTYQDGATRQYAYGAIDYSALTGITDEVNVQYVTFTYTSLGDHVLTTQLAGGVGSYSFGYAENNNAGSSGSVSVTDPLGTTRTYNQQLNWGVYRTAGVSSPCVGCNEDASRVFDSNSNITSRTDFSGNQTTYSYDPATNRELSRTEAYGTANARTITTQWSTDYSVPTLITEPNRTTAFSYDGNGNLLTKTLTDTTATPNVSRTWTYTYDNYGRMLTADGPRTDVSDVTTYTYYTCTTGFECGEVQTVTDAAGNVTTYDSYNAYGQPLSMTDPNGVITTLVYDARMRLISRTTGGETTAFAYYPTGLLQAVTLPDGSSVRYTYDGAHRLIQVKDGAGNSLQYALDAMGNHIGESAYDPNNVLSRALSRVYNTLNELSQSVGAAGTAAVTTTYGYDSSGNQTSIAAPLDRNTAETYDALNRLNTITDPNTGVTHFTYDANDNLIAVQDPLNLTTHYTYDGFGDLLNQVSPSTGTTVNTYDLGGNLATSQDARGLTTHYTYDALNRVTQAAYGDQTIFYGYDAGINGKGRLVSASDSSHSLAWQYDALGRVTSKTQTVGTVTRAVGYTYSNGNLVTLTTPSGQSIAYTYSDHQVSSVTVNGTALLLNITYEPFGPVRGWTLGNGMTETRLHDTDGNPAQFTGAESTSYTLDSAFRITAIANSTNSGLSWNYSYDSLDRITSGANTASSLGWTYDADGNRATANGGPSRPTAPPP